MIFRAIHFLNQLGDNPESTVTAGTHHSQVRLRGITTHSLKSYLVIGSSAYESFTGVPHETTRTKASLNRSHLRV